MCCTSISPPPSPDIHDYFYDFIRETRSDIVWEYRILLNICSHGKSVNRRTVLNCIQCTLYVFLSKNMERQVVRNARLHSGRPPDAIRRGREESKSHPLEVLRIFLSPSDNAGFSSRKLSDCRGLSTSYGWDFRVFRARSTVRLVVAH